jgi:hypothetical protein
MVKLLLGLERVPSPHDAADALAVAICHLHRRGRAPSVETTTPKRKAGLSSWRNYRPPAGLPRA